MRLPPGGPSHAARSDPASGPHWRCDDRVADALAGIARRGPVDLPEHGREAPVRVQIGAGRQAQAACSAAPGPRTRCGCRLGCRRWCCSDGRRNVDRGLAFLYWFESASSETKGQKGQVVGQPHLMANGHPHRNTQYRSAVFVQLQTEFGL